MGDFREFIDRAVSTNFNITYEKLYKDSLKANLYCIVYNTISSEIRECEVSYTLYDPIVSISVVLREHNSHISDKHLNDIVTTINYGEYRIYLYYSLAVREIANDLRLRFDNYLSFLEG